MEFAKIGTLQFALLIIGAVLSFAVPVLISIVWMRRKNERFSTVLVGALTFLLFAILLEKPIQNVLLFPTQLGLADHAISRFVNSSPLLLAFLAGLFPGVFEETGRLVAFKTILKKKKNKETSISHGIGHGGFEVMYILGLTYITYIVYAVMINSGTFQLAVDEVEAQLPGQSIQLYAIAEQLAVFSFADVGLAFVERVFAFLFHVGASIIVFHACRDKGRFWLYPVAVILHTLMDFIVGLNLTGVIALSAGTLEVIIAVFGILTFFGAYILLYKKDREGV